MQVEQNHILERIRVSTGTNENAMAIANFMQEDTNKSGVGQVSGETYQTGKAASVHASGSVYMENATYTRPKQEEEEKSVLEQLENQNQMTAMERSNQAAVIANTTTPEDCARMRQDGFSFEDMDGKTIVTVSDKIKAALAEAGVDVSSYGGSLSKEQLEKLVGNSMLAEQIAKQMTSHDIPMTEENLRDIHVAVSMTEDLHPMDDHTMAYLIRRKLSPSIQNIYHAQHNSMEQQVGYENTKLAVSESDFDAMKDQIAQIIEAAGLPVNEENFLNAKWMLEQDLPLTANNMAYLSDLKTGGAVDIAQSMAEAIAEGKRPWDGMLVEGYSMSELAQQAVSTIEEATDSDISYVLLHEKPLTIENLEIAIKNRQNGVTIYEEKISTQDEMRMITAHRQLEEVRLAMTAKANYALLKKGISIQTEPLARLVEQLKEQENQYYRDLLEQNDVAVTEQRVAVFARTTEVLADLKSAPAYVLDIKEANDTLQKIHEKSQIVKAGFAEVNERYETLMTSPRADMGDSIKKAFQNVDDILKDLGLETNDANRRAVRILAYNRTALTEENIIEMKAKDEQVQRTFANLTPKMTLELIRNNINPLDMELSELNQEIERIKEEDIEQNAQRFSEFLWNLEQKKQITEEEKTSYIGIYRLMAQVEKADGAAIGALAAQGAPLTMRNLLTAVRTAKKGTMDYSVSDEFEGVSAKSFGARIDKQIEAAYQKNCAKDVAAQMTPDLAEQIANTDWQELTPEQLKELVSFDDVSRAQEEAANYDKMQLEEYAKTMTSSQDMYAYLEKNGIPDTMQNMQAMQQLLSDPSQMFRTLWKMKQSYFEGKSFDGKEAIADIKQMILERFGDAVKTPQELADAQETLAEVAEHAMEGMIYDDDTVSYPDIRMMRLMNRQLSICARQAKEENYVIPVETSEGITGVSLKIVRGKEQKGLVDILFRGASMGKVAASFEAKEKGISGMIATDEEETARTISEHLKELTDALKETEDAQVDLRVAVVPDLSLKQYALRADSRRSQYTGEHEPMQTSRLYHIAEGFIKSVQKFL